MVRLPLITMTIIMSLMNGKRVIVVLELDLVMATFLEGDALGHHHPVQLLPKQTHC